MYKKKGCLEKLEILTTPSQLLRFFFFETVKMMHVVLKFLRKTGRRGREFSDLFRWFSFLSFVVKLHFSLSFQSQGVLIPLNNEMKLLHFFPPPKNWRFQLSDSTA